MLNNEQFAAWAQRCGLSPDAIAVVQAVRRSPPRRRVRSGIHNVSGRFASAKMAATVQFESHTVELPAIYLMEHDAEVLEFYDQPGVPVKLTYQQGERHIGVLHTADFFVVMRSGAEWVEWKREEELVRLAARSPGRYAGTTGDWRCPPGEAFAVGLGLTYRVASSAELNRTLVANLELLDDYLRTPRQLDPDVLARIRRTVLARPGLSVAELTSTDSADAVFGMIAAGDLFVSLEEQALADPLTCRVFGSPEQASAARASHPMLSSPAAEVVLAPGTLLNWDGAQWEILNVGLREVTLRPVGQASAGTSTRIGCDELRDLMRRGLVVGLPRRTPASVADSPLLSASPLQLAEANRRWRAVAAHLAGRDPGEPKRTVARWLARFRAAEAAGGWGYVGLLPFARGGERGSRLPADCEALIDRIVTAHYAQPRALSAQAAYALLVAACRDAGIPAPSQNTLRRRLRQARNHDMERRRLGRRAAYKSESFHLWLSTKTPRHGQRPFEIAHLDHTLLDVEVIDRRTGRNLGRPWLTILVDAHSRRILALWLAFDPPSYRACMMALRLCVARHARLPQTLVVDGGAEFRSVYFETLVARYGVTLKTRPAAKARFGSVCERLFGTSNTQLVHQLPGNTKATRQVRTLSREVDPQRLARLDLLNLWDGVTRWAYEIYDNLDHPALGESPAAAFATGMARFGERPQRMVPYDDAFLISTMPTTPKGTATVHPTLGVRVNYVYYWNEAFRNPMLHGAAIPVRFDPFDARAAVAFANGQWLSCFAPELSVAGAASVREVLVAHQELRRRRALHGAGAAARALRVGEFLSSIEAGVLLDEQRARDDAMRQVLQRARQPPRSTPRLATEVVVAAEDPGNSWEELPRASLTHGDYR